MNLNRFENTLDIISNYKKCRKTKYNGNKKEFINYINCACSFDIETTSFKYNDTKYAWLYLFAFCIDGNVFFGRDWNDFLEYINLISKKLNLNYNNRIVIYTHNLSYEFQFFRKWVEIDEVFAIDERRPVTVLLKNGVEFKCSYILTNKKLSDVAKDLHNININKLGNLFDYNKIRTPKTPLKMSEYRYVKNDVLIVYYLINNKINTDGSIVKIPLTNTGYVRNFLRKCCFYGFEKDDSKKTYYDYKNIMNCLKLNLNDYVMLKKAFTGGFTHASAFNSSITHSEVSSYDFNSSYPAVLCSEKYPMSKAFYKNHFNNYDEFIFYLKNYCCVFEIEFFNIKSKFIFEHLISLSKCIDIKNYTADNGRIINADYLKIIITEIDYNLICDVYDFDKNDIIINNFKYFKKAYLPKNFIKGILSLYADKTRLKGTEDLINYQIKKEMLNAAYGCCVMDIVRDEINYINDSWRINRIDDSVEAEKMILKNNENKKRFLYYPWGVWCCKYAMFNLWQAILYLKEDYIYSDTDSVKFFNDVKHDDFFINYNNNIKNKLLKMVNHYELDPCLINPITVNGDNKLLGVWDFEGTYNKFKTLGAKRYLYEDGNGKLHITVSGVVKKNGEKYLSKFKDPFEMFNNDLIFKGSDDKDEDFTGKKTLTYIDEEFEIEVCDYLGGLCVIKEKSCIHMEACDYKMSIKDEYLDLLKNYKEMYFL